MIRNLLAELAKWLNGQRGLVMQTQGLTKLSSDLHTHAVAHVTPLPILGGEWPNTIYFPLWPKIRFFSFLRFLLHVWVFFRMYVRHMCLGPSEGRRHKLSWDWMVVSHHVGVRNKTQLLCKASRCPWLLSHLSCSKILILKYLDFHETHPWKWEASPQLVMIESRHLKPRGWSIWTVLWPF